MQDNQPATSLTHGQFVLTRAPLLELLLDHVCGTCCQRSSHWPMIPIQTFTVKLGDNVGHIQLASSAREERRWIDACHATGDGILSFTLELRDAPQQRAVIARLFHRRHSQLQLSNRRILHRQLTFLWSHFAVHRVQQLSLQLTLSLHRLHLSHG